MPTLVISEYLNIGGLLIAYKKRTRINRDITAPQVRLINAEGAQLGIVPNQEAQQQAMEAGLDLAEIDPNADPPVCRIMDYKKTVFEKKKKQGKNTKKQKQTQLKQIRFTSRTEQADYQVKLRSIIRFLEAGDKVKVSLRFRGREMAHQDLGLNLLERVEQDLVEYGTVEQRPKLEGRQMIMVLFPLKKQSS